MNNNVLGVFVCGMLPGKTLMPYLSIFACANRNIFLPIFDLHVLLLVSLCLS